MTRIHKFYNDCVKRLAWMTPPETSKAPEPAAAKKPDFKETQQYKETKDAIDKYGQGKNEVDFKTAFRLAETEFRKNYGEDADAARALAELESDFNVKKDAVEKDYKERKETAAKSAKEKIEGEIKKEEGLLDMWDTYKIQVAGEEITLNQGEYAEYLKAPDKTAYLQGKVEAIVREKAKVEAAKKQAEFMKKNETGSEETLAKFKEGEKEYEGGDYFAGGKEVSASNYETEHVTKQIALALYLQSDSGELRTQWDKEVTFQENESQDWNVDEGFYYSDIFDAADQMAKGGGDALRELHTFMDSDAKAFLDTSSTYASDARGFLMGCLLSARVLEKNGDLTAEEGKGYETYLRDTAKGLSAKYEGKYKSGLYEETQKTVLLPKQWKEMKDAEDAAVNGVSETLNMKETEESYKDASAKYDAAVKEGFAPSPELQALKEVLPADPKDLEFNHKPVVAEFVKLLGEELEPFNEKKEAEALVAAENYKGAAEAYKKGVDEYVAAAEKMTKGIEDAKTLEDINKLEPELANLDSLDQKVRDLGSAVGDALNEAEGKLLPGRSQDTFREASLLVDEAGALTDPCPYESIKAAYEAKKKSLETAAPAGTPGKVPGNAPEAQKETPPDNLAEAQSLLEEAPDDTPELKEIKTHYKGKLDEVLKSGKPKEEQEKEIDAITTQYQLEILARGFEAQDNYERLAKQVKDSYTERQTRLTEEIANVKKQLEAAQAEQSPDQTKIENLQAQIAPYEGDLAGTNFNLKVLEQLERDPYKEYPLSKRAVILAHMLEEYSMPGAEKNLHERLGDEAYKKLFEISGQPDFWGENWENPDNLPDPNSTDPAVQAERAKFDKANKRYEAKVAEFTGQNLTMTGKERNFRMPGGMQLREAGTDESVKLISGEIHYVKAENGRYAPFVKVETGEGDTAEQGWVALNLLRKGKGEGGGGGKKEKKEEEGPEKKQTPEIVLENRVREIVDLLTGAATLIENHNVPPKTDEDRQRLGEAIGKYIRAHATYNEMMAKGGTIMKTLDGKPCPKGPVKIKLQNSDFNREIQWDGKKLSIPGGMAEFFSGGDLDNGKGAYENCVKVLTAKGLPTDPKALEKWAKGNGCSVHDNEVLHYDRKVVTPEAMQKIADKIDGVHAKWTMLVADTEAGLNSKTITPYQAAEFVEKSKEILNDYQGCMDLLGKHNDIIGSVPEEDPHLQAKLYTKTAIQADIARVEQIKSGCLVFLESSGLLDDNGKVEKSKLQTPDKEQQLAEYERKLDGIRSFVDQLDAKLQGYIDDLAAWKKDPDDDDLKKAAYEAGLNLPSIPNTAILAWTQVKTLNDRAREASLTLSGDADVKNKLVRIFNATIKFPTADRRTLLERKARESDLIS